MKQCDKRNTDQIAAILSSAAQSLVVTCTLKGDFWQFILPATARNRKGITPNKSGADASSCVMPSPSLRQPDGQLEEGV